MHSKQWHYSLHRDFQNCYSTRRSPTGFFSSNSSSNSTRVPIHPPYTIHIYMCTSREFSIQNTILHAEDKDIFQYYYYIQRAKRPSFQKRNSTHRRQGDLLEMHPCVLQDLPMTFQVFQPQDLPKALQLLQRHSRHSSHSWPSSLPGNSTSCSSISRDSTQFQHSPIRMHILQFDFVSTKTPPSTSWTIQTINILQTVHSSKKGRCCDIGQTCIGKKDVKMTYFLE